MSLQPPARMHNQPIMTDLNLATIVLNPIMTNLNQLVLVLNQIMIDHQIMDPRKPDHPTMDSNLDQIMVVHNQAHNNQTMIDRVHNHQTLSDRAHNNQTLTDRRILNQLLLRILNLVQLPKAVMDRILALNRHQEDKQPVHPVVKADTHLDMVVLDPRAIINQVHPVNQHRPQLQDKIRHQCLTQPEIWEICDNQTQRLTYLVKVNHDHPTAQEEMLVMKKCNFATGANLNDKQKGRGKKYT